MSRQKRRAQSENHLRKSLFHVETGWRFYKNIGCFKDKGARAIAPLDGKLGLLRGNYRARKDSILKCGAVAAVKGHRIFGVQHGGWCASTSTGHLTYAKYGRARNCKNGKGGAWANDVYKLKGIPQIV